MLFLRRSPYRAYLAAIVGIGLIFATRIAVQGWLGPFFASLAFILTVVAAGALGGWKPGVFVTTLCVGVWAFFFLESQIRFAIPAPVELLRMSGYMVLGVAISVLCEFLHAAWDRIEERQRLLEQEVAERRKAEVSVLEHAERLQEADRRKDEFLAMLAHELRNPLAPLSNALQLWPIVENDRAQMDELRSMMERQVSQMTRLINDLMDVSRISRGKIALQREPVDLATVISGAVESLSSLLESRGHRLTLSLPPHPILVDGDVARLTQVFGNILHNAAKYTGHDGVISVVAQDQAPRAVVRIRDNGPGIPKPMLSQIFDMFQQVDKTLHRSHGGLGIGLTLVKRIVELHGGTVEAHSDGPGQGSELVVNLPMATAARSDPQQSAGPRSLRDITGLPSNRILVVDDVEASATTLALMLRSMGQDVATTHNGAAALDWLRSNRTDLVFLDIAMPGMDGYDVARRLRGEEFAEDLLLIALTGYGQDEDRRRAIEAGFDHHMTKPASIDALHELLQKRRGPRRPQRFGQN